ncbi:MAG: CPBP family intramembrane glutamic endopeptidase [Cyanobacteriota bacterium]
MSIRSSEISFFDPISFLEDDIFKNMIINQDSILKGVYLGSGLFILSNIIVFLTPQLKKSLKLLDEMIIGKLETRDAFLIALLSGISEEIFFRGILQNGIGLIPSSIVFALLHFPSKEFLVYSLWTFLAGLFFGNIYEMTGNLFIPIVAHIINNLIALLLWKKVKRFF